ncbi:hypothetical protein [Actimicrobium sp. CCI2.3]|uniref:hypothetical protein n=1 Tax=Actimicrobium sp. CCI2.3 TaxID=3048616 RepID=UPI002AB3B9FD|nr:hypothetical protein [Actimicrobium sp. CCI2.3]MDY7573160.1 hypothetical protein [Actimicrobium sp. CCI2.3]MEB0022139.1 hypothetical protein [Actimicrobium sp. CCI2.3]
MTMHSDLPPAYMTVVEMTAVAAGLSLCSQFPLIILASEIAFDKQFFVIGDSGRGRSHRPAPPEF